METTAGMSLGINGMQKSGYFQVGGDGAARGAGFTLIELLVVIAIVSLMAGLSAQAFIDAQRNYGLAASAGEIQSIFRRARNQSISNGTGSFVVVEPETREVWAQSFETMGEWSFEELGAEDEDLPTRKFQRLYGGEEIEGRLGTGVSFLDGGGYIDCGHRAAFDLKEGVVVEAWIRHFRKPPLPRAPNSAKTSGRRRRASSSNSRQSVSAARTIIAKEDSWFLGMTPEGALEGSIGTGAGMTPYVLVTEDDVVAPGRWVFVSLRYDGRELVLSADGVQRMTWPLLRPGQRGAPELPGEIQRNTNPVVISSEDLPFPGDIDEVRLRGRSERAVFKHPPFNKIIGWKKIIHFDRYGHLDPVFHEKKVRIVLMEIDDERFSKTARAQSGKNAANTQVDRFELTFAEFLDTWPLGEAPDWTEEEEELEILDNYLDAQKKIIVIDTLGVVHVQ